MAIKGPRSNERKRLARIVSLVLSAMKNLPNEDGCTIGKIVDYITDVGCQSAPKREVVTALKRSVEFGIMKKRRGRYFLKYNGENLTPKDKKVVKKVTKPKTKEKLLIVRPVRGKIRRKKRRSNKIKSTRDRRKSLRKSAIKRMAKSRHWSSSKPHKFFELYVNPCCRVSAKSSVASTQMLLQEETENCAEKC